MKSQWSKTNLAKRILSLVLVFVMVFSLAPGTTGLENVHAAGEHKVMVHYRNDNNWSNVNCYTWNGADMGAWPGTAMTKNENNDGWYDIELSNVTAGTINIIFNDGSNQTADLEFSISGDTEIWATGKIEQNSFDFSTTAPEGWKNEDSSQTPEETYDVTLHFSNPNSWNNVNVYTWSGVDMGEWPGTGVITKNINNPAWYDVSFTDVAAAGFNFIFNNGAGGEGNQTGDLSTGTLTADTELWVKGVTAGDVSVAVPEGWVTEASKDLTIHYDNSNGWSSVCAYAWDDTGNTLLGAWPGTGLSENAEHEGWYDVTLENVVGKKVNFIFNNNNNGAQTADLSNAVALDAAELWVVDEKVTADESWNENQKDPEENGYILTVHYSNPNNWSNVNGYVWMGSGNYINGAWPGGALPKNAEHTEWYDLVVKGLSAGVVNFIFNDGSSQTADLAATIKDKNLELWYDGETFTEEESWNGIRIEEAEVNSEFRPTDKLEVKVGSTLTTMDVYMDGTYEAQVEVGAGDYTATLVVNGVETTDTVSGTLNEAKTLIFRTVDDKLTVVEKCLSAALVGNFTGISFVDEDGKAYSITSWNPADENAELTYIGGGIYKGTFKFKTLAEDVIVADGGYKVAFDDSWDFSIGEGSGNIALTIPAGTSQLTVYADAVRGIVYDSVRSANFTVVQNSGSLTKPALDTTISIIGSVRGDESINWNTTTKGYEFTQISETLYRYQNTYKMGEYAYKCVFDESWYEAEAGNRTITLTSDSYVVFLYDTESGKLYDTVNNPKEVAEFLHMTASAAQMQTIDNLNGTTRFVAAVDGASSVDLYYGNKAEVEAKGTAALKKVSLTKANNGTFQSSDLFLGDSALEVVFYYDVNNGTRTLDASKDTVTIVDADYSVYTRVKFTGRVVTVPGTLPNGMNTTWDTAYNQMNYIGNGLYELTIKDVPAANYEYKIAIDKSWGENYGADGQKDGANIQVAVPSLMDVTVWYNDFSHRAVDSVNYVRATIVLSGTGIPEGTQLTDPMLTGIYSVTVTLPAGIYSDLEMDCDGTIYKIPEFTLTEKKEVTFYIDPSSGIFYNDASDTQVETKEIYFDSKDEAYKSVYGAVEAGENVTFRIDTGLDASNVSLIVKGANKKGLQMNLAEQTAAGKTFEVTTSFDNIGENKYYFAVSNGSSIKIYTDDDGYYGVGHAIDLANLTTYYDLVVYEKGFTTPDWMKNAVIYQIFPDRFYDGDESNNDNQTHARGAVNYEYITDWYALPENPQQEGYVAAGTLSEEAYKATGAYWGDGEWSNEMYGGDLEGIIEKIDYLKELGVNVIYLNPVFSSISNHRYDTSDYTKIDPILGTEGDFAELVKVAEENDMHIILDGVFNHVSDDSIYFDRYYRYLGTSEKIGAYPYWAYVYDYMKENGASKENAESAAKEYFTSEYGITDYAYTEWVEVYNSQLVDTDGELAVDTVGLRAGKPVYGYDGWWGYDSMPVIKSTNGSEYQTGNWAEEIIYAEDGSSVSQYWISKGNNGWRLDVANEVSDETWQRFRDSVKALDSDAVIIGEIWTDATEYLLGDMYDSVMNYVFRGAVTNFAMGTSAEDATKTLEKLRERYPEEAFYAMMNLVASHDTSRVLSYLDGIGDDRADTSLSAAFPTFETTSQTAKDRQKLVAFLQFTYAGAPTIYYGDEIAMAGADDPDDRRAFTWGKGDKETLLWYASLADIRNNYEALRTGSVEAFTLDSNLMGYVRRLNENVTDKNLAIVVANNADASTVTLDLNELNVTATEFVDLISGTKYTAAGTARSAGTTLTVNIPAMSKGGVILVPADEAFEISVNEDALKSAYDASYVIAERSATPPADSKEDDDSSSNTGSGNEGSGSVGGNSSKDETSGRKEAGTASGSGSSVQTATGAATGDALANVYVICAVMICAAVAAVVVSKKRKQQS